MRADDPRITTPLSPEVRQRLYDEDAVLIGKPFDVSANPRAIQAHTRRMAQMMMDRSTPDGASRMAAFAEDMMDTLLHADVKGPVACGKGCSWCCTTFVSASIPEIFNLARAVRTQPAMRARVLEAAQRSRATPQDRREISRIVCPILELNACGAYTHRPMVCRSLLSTSLEVCMQILVENRPAVMTHVDKTPVIRTFGVIMVKAALALCGLPNQHLELIQGLAVALADDTGEARWLAGEPLFAGVPADTVDSDPSPLTAMVNTLVNVIRPTIAAPGMQAV